MRNRKIMPTEEFIRRANLVHGNKYLYHKTEYVGQNSKVTITCRDHGDFVQSPAHHISRRQGCSKCADLHRWDNREKINYTIFVNKCSILHNYKYSYPEQLINGNKTMVEIICSKHGSFLQIAVSHLSGSGCPKCSFSFKKDNGSFIEKAQEIHGDKYDYSKFEYVNCKTKGIIMCPIHGEFTQTPDLHLNAQCGCPRCGSGGTYSEWYFKDENTRNEQGILYLVELSNETECFLKVGITIKNANKRSASPSKNGGYKTRIILQRDMNMYNAWKLEQKILSEFKDDKYTPLRYFPGHTECLNKTNESMILKGML